MANCLPVFLLIASTCAVASDPFALVGTVANTTNPKQPISADAVMTFDKDGKCILKISPPLYGSGTCALKTYDQQTGHIEITSEGVLLNINASGTAKGDFITGTYTVVSPSTPELPQVGTFQFRFAPGPTPVTLADVLNWSTFKSGDEEFLVIKDGDAVSVHHKDGKYAGIRLFLGKEGTPTFFIQDTEKGSLYRDIKTQSVLLTWVKDGDTGYFIQPVNGGNTYLDRFMQPTGYSSIEVNKQTVFIHEVNGDVELLDANLKPLGIRSAKTKNGQVYWSKSTGNVTEFLDQSFKPLGWYSIELNGNTYYARSRGQKKFTFYDASMRELKRPSNGFWANFATGMSAGLAGYGNAMQQAAAYRAQQVQTYQAYTPQTYAPRPYVPQPSYTSTTMGQPRMSTTTATDSLDNAYMTNTQRMGNFTFSNTTGSNGYTANSTTTQMGPFAFMNGTSSNGGFSGTSNQLGNFNFTNLTTPAGTWNGTSTQLGNFTFHNFTGPNGQMLTGTSTRIGDFIFTNIH
jgi:hypothetical protein